jgi:hypothetical protein
MMVASLPVRVRSRPTGNRHKPRGKIAEFAFAVRPIELEAQAAIWLLRDCPFVRPGTINRSSALSSINLEPTVRQILSTLAGITFSR